MSKSTNAMKPAPDIWKNNQTKLLTGGNLFSQDQDDQEKSNLYNIYKQNQERVFPQMVEEHPSFLGSDELNEINEAGEKLQSDYDYQKQIKLKIKERPKSSSLQQNGLQSFASVGNLIRLQNVQTRPITAATRKSAGGNSLKQIKERKPRPAAGYKIQRGKLDSNKQFQQFMDQTNRLNKKLQAQNKSIQEKHQQYQTQPLSLQPPIDEDDQEDQDDMDEVRVTSQGFSSRDDGHHSDDHSIQKDQDFQGRVSSANTQGHQLRKKRGIFGKYQKYLALGISPYSQDQLDGSVFDLQAQQKLSFKRNELQKSLKSASQYQTSFQSGAVDPMKTFKEIQNQQQQYFDSQTRNKFNYPKIFFQKKPVCYAIFQGQLDTSAQFDSRMNEQEAETQPRNLPMDRNDIMAIQNQLYAEDDANNLQVDQQQSTEFTNYNESPPKGATMKQGGSFLGGDGFAGTKVQQNLSATAGTGVLQGMGSGLLSATQLGMSEAGADMSSHRGAESSPSAVSPDKEGDGSPEKDAKKKEKSKSKKDDKKGKKKDKDKGKDKKEEDNFFTDIDLEDIRQLPNNRMFFGEIAKDTMLMKQHKKQVFKQRNEDQKRALSQIPPEQQASRMSRRAGPSPLGSYVSTSLTKFSSKDTYFAPFDKPKTQLKGAHRELYDKLESLSKKSQIYSKRLNNLNSKLEEYKQRKPMVYKKPPIPKPNADLQIDKQDHELLSSKQQNLIKECQMKKKDEKERKEALSLNFAGKPYGGIKPRENLLTRLNIDEDLPDRQREIDEEHYEQYAQNKKKMVYEIEDVNKELEILTDDESEIEQKAVNNPHLKEIWNIKKNIKISFKRDGKAPDTTMDYYKLGRVLGRGSYGKVNIALHKLTRKIVAVKSVAKNKLNSRDNDGLKKRIDNERSALEKVRHKNCVKYFESLETDTHQLFFMEICQGGDLLHYIRRRRRLEEYEAKYFFRQLIHGIGYLHSMNMIHRDIKLENIMIDNEGVIKIGDFGTCGVPGLGAYGKEMNKDKLTGKYMMKASKNPVGTYAYMAPEMCKPGNLYGQKVDVWAAGVVLYVMVHGYMPFSATKFDENQQDQLGYQVVSEELMNKRLIGQITLGNYIIGEQVSDDLRNLLDQILAPDENSRISLVGILKHPWLTKMDDDKKEIEIFNKYEYSKIKAEFIFRDQEIDTSQKVDLSNKAAREKLLKLGHRISESGYLIKTKSKDEAREDNRLDMCDFEDIDFNSTHDPQIRNMTTLSDILGPYNSNQSKSNASDTLSDVLRKEIEDELQYQIIDEKEFGKMLAFDIRCIEANKQYQYENNEELDQGIILHPEKDEAQILKEQVDTINKKKKKKEKAREDNKDQQEVENVFAVEEEELDEFQDDFFPQEAIVKQVCDFGYEDKGYILQCLDKKLPNYCSTTYYLLAKNQDTINARINVADHFA